MKGVSALTRDEESRLVKAAAGGDEAAFESLVTENQKLVYNLAFKLTGNPEDALDVSQDTFIKAYTNLGSFRGDSRFSVWIYRLAYNACMDHVRKNRGGTVSMTMTDDDDEESQFDLPDPAPQPEELAEKRDIQRAVREAVAALPDDKRKIIVMREFSGMSYTDIAAALNVEEGTVKSRLARARSALAAILRENGTFSRDGASNAQEGRFRE